MEIQALIDLYGAQTVLNELLQWLTTDQIEEFTEDFKRLYDYDEMEN